MKFIGCILIIYFIIIIISTLFPKKVVDKYNIKEFERIKKERDLIEESTYISRSNMNIKINEEQNKVNEMSTNEIYPSLSTYENNLSLYIYL